jgi:hypothetical protein
MTTPWESRPVAECFGQSVDEVLDWPYPHFIGALYYMREKDKPRAD